MGKSKETQNQELPKLDINDVLKDYSLAELKFQACENHLLGNFDKDKNYKILDIIYPELINLQKVLGKRTSGFYTASCYIEQTTLNFVVKIEKPEEGQISATLILEEKLIFAKNFETIISTPIKTLTDYDSPDFAFKVRSAFHLVNEEDADEMTLFENYVSPPIELVTELLKKAEMLEALKSGRDKLENEYMNAMLKALRKTKEGTALVKNFFGIIKQNGLYEENENRVRKLKQLLDYLIDEKIGDNVLPEETLEEIAEIRNTFLVQTKQEAFAFMQNKNKSGFKGFLGVKKNLDKELVKQEHKEEKKENSSSATPPPAPSQSSSAEKDNKSKKEPSKKSEKKDDRYTPIFDTLGAKPKSEIQKPFWTQNWQQETLPPEPEVRTNNVPPASPVPPSPKPPENNKLNFSILGRARQDGDKTTILVVKQSVVVTAEYEAAIQTGVENNFGVSIGVSVTATQTVKTEVHEVELSR